MRFLSLLLGPTLVFGWAKFRNELNTWIVSQGVVAEVGAYTGTGLLLCAVLLTNMVGSSASAVVTIACGLLRKLNKGHDSWVSETLRKLSGPLARASQAVLAFVTVNMFINAIPETMAWEVPKLLRFCDVNGDGTLEAEEIEAMFYHLSIMPLGCYLVLQLALFLQNVRRPPSTPIPDSAKDPLGMYLRGLQKLRKQMRGKSDQVAKQYLILRLVDLVLAGAIWVATAVSWVSIIGVPLRAVVASLAPLGIGGLAFSLAAKNIMQNVISGGLIFLNRAFVEGDEIHSQGGISGVVTEVGLINTKVLRLEGDPMVIPNSQLVDNSIVNVQRRHFWLIDRKIPLYMSSFERLPEVVAAMDRTLKERVAHVSLPGSAIKSISVYEEPVCYFSGFGHQGAEIRVRAYVNGKLNRHKFYEVSSEIMLALNRVAFAFEGAGVGFEAHILSGAGQQPSHGHADHSHGAHGHEGHTGVPHPAEEILVGVDKRNSHVNEVHASQGPAAPSDEEEKQAYRANLQKELSELRNDLQKFREANGR